LADTSRTVAGAAATVPGLGTGDADGDGDRDRVADGDGRGRGGLRRGAGAVLAAGLVAATSAGVLAAGADDAGPDGDGTGPVLGAVLPGPGAAADGLATGLRLASAISGVFAWCSRSAANTVPPPSSSRASTATPAATA
jgi:hypothetical protein